MSYTDLSTSERDQVRSSRKQARASWQLRVSSAEASQPSVASRPSLSEAAPQTLRKHRTTWQQRPAIVDTRERVGDWEADLVIGAGHQSALLTLNERRSRLTLIAPSASKKASVVADAMISLLKPLAAHVHTITNDNGKEFAEHARIAKALNAEIYFAHPYSSWERGANENMNGLIRQFFPKDMNLKCITKQAVKKAQELLNHRPRKCLRLETPFNVFSNALQSEHRTVALQT